MHRLIGVLVYAGALLATCSAAASLRDGSSKREATAPSRRARSASGIAVPIACYLGVALALPLLHRALGHGSPQLAEHAAQTSIALALMAALAVLGGRLLDRLSSRRARPCARSCR